MASVVGLRILLGASLGLGILDVAWIDLALAPELAMSRGERAPVDRSVARIETVMPVAGVPAPVPDHLAHDDDVPTAPPPAVLPPRTPVTVYFATLSATLDDDTRATVRRLVDETPPDGVFVLEGHADQRGDESFNRRLSRDRAIAVAREIERLGVPATRVRVGFVGEAGATADDVWRDRRVDIQITGGTR